MSELISQLQTASSEAIKAHYGVEVPSSTFNIQETRKDFEGELTIVVFPLSKYRLGSPPQVGEQLGNLLKERLDFVEDFNVVKGFLNLSLSTPFWLDFLAEQKDNADFFQNNDGKGRSVVVEYCSPNTNKPLHMGHLRNIALGYSLAQILEANGYTPHHVCLYNDRGTAICKSMYSWKMSGKNETPESSRQKGRSSRGRLLRSFFHTIQKRG